MSLGDTTLREAHEQGLARFLRSNRRARFLAMLADARMRRTLQRELAHFEGRLDSRYARPRCRRKQERHLDSVYLVLVEAGAPATCFVVSDGRLDGREVSLREAVDELMPTGAGLISCIPGRLGLYVGEDGSSVWVLSRDT
jgi:hypothetical protein